MIVGWTAGGGLTEIVRENAFLGTSTDRILRIYPPEQAQAQASQIFVKVDLDTDDDCLVDDSVIVPVGDGPPPSSVLEIPALGEVGMLAMAALLFFFALRTMRTGRRLA
jgi:hypothetical protein